MRHKCRFAKRAARQAADIKGRGANRGGNMGWLGRQDSNLRMAVPKTAWLEFRCVTNSLKTAEICGSF